MSEAKSNRPGRDTERNAERGSKGSAIAELRDSAPAAPVESPVLPVMSAPPTGERETEQPVGSESRDEPPAAAPPDAWGAFDEVQAALARGVTEIAVAMTAMTRSGVDVAANAAVAMLDARTFAEAAEINATLARRGADALIESSAR